MCSRAAGWQLAVLTRSSTGAVAISGRGQVEVPAVKVTVADTVGAGDTFTAASLARLAQRELLTKATVATLSPDQITDMLAFAAKAAAVTVSRPGADPPWLRELS